MSTPRFPRLDYAALELYDPGRRPVECDLSDNTNLWGTHPDALEVVRTAGTDELARYPSLYADALRDAVAEVFEVERDQVATGAGSDDVLDSLWRAVAQEGGRISYPAPTFSMMESFSLMNGREPRPVRWSTAEADPMTLLASDPCLVYLCRPNNPTGAQLPVAWVERLVDEAERRGTVVVIDEAYADFAADDLLAWAATRERVVVTRTMSKAFGLAGMRVGFAVGAAGVIREIEKSRGPYKVGRIDELAAAAALRDRSGWTAGCVAETKVNRARLAEELRTRGFVSLPSEANFLFVPVPDGRGREISDRLRDRQVSVRPFLGTDDWGDALRVTVGPWTMMERFLTALEAVREEIESGAQGIGETPEAMR